MPKVNLLPKEELETRPLGRFLQWALSYGRYIIISVELVVFLVFFSRFIFDRQLADLNDEIEQKHAIIASAATFEDEFRHIQSHMSYISELDENRTIYIDILRRLKEIMPLNVSITSLSFTDTKITMEGVANNNESFAQFLAQLKNEDRLASISLDSLAKEEDSDQEITFSISATIGIPDSETEIETEVQTP